VATRRKAAAAPLDAALAARLRLLVLDVDGVLTDGDLRRALDARIDVHAATMQDVMTRRCRSIGPRELAAEAVHVMETHRITALPVVDAAGALVGALNVHDLLRAGVV
jgi:arabinose-5-phosphate isomerase